MVVAWWSAVCTSADTPHALLGGVSGGTVAAVHAPAQVVVVVVVAATARCGVKLLRTGAVDAFAVQICLAHPLATSVAMRTLHRWIQRLGWDPQSRSCCLARSPRRVRRSLRAGPCLPKTSTATPVTARPALRGYSRSFLASPLAAASFASYRLVLLLLLLLLLFTGPWSGPHDALSLWKNWAEDN